MITDQEFAVLLPEIFAPWIEAKTKGETRNGYSSLHIVRKAVRLGLQEIEKEHKKRRGETNQFLAELDRS